MSPNGAGEGQNQGQQAPGAGQQQLQQQQGQDGGQPQAEPQGEGRGQQQGQGRPKGQPSQEQQIARIVSEQMGKQLTPIMESLRAIAPQTPAGDDGDAKGAAAKAADELEAVIARHAEEAKRWAVERTLLTGGCIDAAAAMAHIDMAGAKLSEDGTLEGVDVKALAEKHPYLFKAAEKPPTVSTGASGSSAPDDKPVGSIADGVAAAFKKKGN
ncbi:phage scaffolding protein [Slackia exigua]|uniref:phage scaffolding protein n=1 Tax=Slackia exigua TaxID=84109 RepID=UPI003BA3C9D5